nr:hypothetical protein HK105_006096 [Polyrhizophydium stewartii]
MPGEDDFEEFVCSKCASEHAFLMRYAQDARMFVRKAADADDAGEAGGIRTPSVAAGSKRALDAGGKSLLDAGMQQLNEIDRVRAIDGIRAYNKFKDRLMEFLRGFGSEGKVVCKEDIERFFEEQNEMRRKRMRR